MMRFAWILVLLVVPVFATAADAELFRCTDADGKAVYTDRKDTCPGAEETEPQGVVHHAETPEAPAPDAGVAPAAPAPARARESAEEVAAADWKQKKRVAEQQVDVIHERREFIKRYLSYCNRGAWVTTRDESGNKEVVNCTELHSEFNALEAKEAAAREYLATGLADECRRAGCKPGWVR